MHDAPLIFQSILRTAIGAGRLARFLYGQVDAGVGVPEFHAAQRARDGQHVAAYHVLFLFICRLQAGIIRVRGVCHYTISAPWLNQNRIFATGSRVLYRA